MDDGSGIETMEEDLPLGMPLEERDSGVASLYGGRSNPPSTGSSVISWRNLRLQSAINNEKQIKGRVFGTGAQVVRKLTNFRGLIGARANKDESVRPYTEMLYQATAENWADYIRNMNALDISAELSAEVAPQDKLSIYGFLKEWKRPVIEHSAVELTLVLISTRNLLKDKLFTNYDEERTGPNENGLLIS